MLDDLNNYFRNAFVGCCWFLIVSVSGYIQAVHSAQPGTRSVATSSTGNTAPPGQVSRGAVTLSTHDTGRMSEPAARPSSHRISSGAVLPIFAYSYPPPMGYCGVVRHIEHFLHPDYGDIDRATNPPISGMVAIPFGRFGDQSFFADVTVAGPSGYYPAEKNIEETVYFRIHLTLPDGGHYTVTEQRPPSFQPGDGVLLNEFGVLERADCKTDNPQ